MLDKGHFYDHSVRIIIKNKEIKWMLINASLINDSANKPTSIQALVRDITLQRDKKITPDLISNKVKSILGQENIYKMQS